MQIPHKLQNNWLIKGESPSDISDRTISILFFHQGPHKNNSSTVSRILSWTIIPLGQKLLAGSSNLPEGTPGSDLAPSYLILLRAEFGYFHSLTPRHTPVPAYRIIA